MSSNDDLDGSSVALDVGGRPKSQFKVIAVKGALGCRAAFSREIVPSDTFSSCASRVYLSKLVRPYGPADLSGMEMDGSSVALVLTLRHGTDGN